MKDVFKYFKHVRSLQESRGAEKAAELGYQHQARGVYVDPKTQKKYKNTGDKLEPIADEPTAEKGSGGGEPSGGGSQQPSLNQFQQQATKRGDIKPNGEVVGGIPNDKKIEILAKGMSGGRWDQLDAARRKLLMQAATEKMAQIEAQKAAEAEAAMAEPEPEPAPEPQPEPVKEPAKKPEDFPTLDDKMAEKDDGTGGALDALLGDLRKTPKKATPKKATPKAITDRKTAPKGVSRTDVPQFKS